jgi:hypothetical protein
MRAPYEEAGPEQPPDHSAILEGRPDTLRDLGWRLRHHREAQRRPLDEIAAAVALAPATLAAIERGEIDLPFSTVEALVQALDLEWWNVYGADFPIPTRTHTLSVSTEQYHAIEAGLQPFLIVRDAPHFRVRDRIHLSEEQQGRHTERVATVVVTYLLYATSDPQLDAVMPGYVLLGIASSLTRSAGGAD